MLKIPASYLALGALTLFVLGYHCYGRYLSYRLFDLDDDSLTPAVKHADGIDFVPTVRSVLFGHHFSSIAGAAPIVGPAVAIIWGWVPALLWVVLGTIFMGAAHDLGALVLSMRHEGKSIGGLAEDVIGPRAKTLFLLVTLFLVWLVIAVFALVIAKLFISYPSSVLPVNFEILIALAIGYFINKKGGNLTWPSLLAQLGLLLFIYLGTLYPISLEVYFGPNETMAWIVLLLIYGFISSILPVWTLLQPRDYINSHQLFLGLGALLVGLFISNPQVVAPAINPHPPGAPFWFPFLFITIACGAVSGFHGLVSSGTTSKQVKTWKDARSIGYGSMVGEGVLALVATLAVATGFSSPAAWHQHYSSWGEAKGLTSAIQAFVQGCTQFLSGIGLPPEFANTAIAVLIISFAATSLDTATRIQRYVMAELGASCGIKILRNRYLASALAVGTAFALILVEGGGKGGLLLWPLFGASNQMLAVLTLAVIAAFLARKKKPTKAYTIPLIFLVLVTSLGLIYNMATFYSHGQLTLAVMSCLLLVVELWIVAEAYKILSIRTESR